MHTEHKGSWEINLVVMRIKSEALSGVLRKGALRKEKGGVRIEDSYLCKNPAQPMVGEGPHSPAPF